MRYSLPTPQDGSEKDSSSKLNLLIIVAALDYHIRGISNKQLATDPFREPTVARLSSAGVLPTPRGGGIVA